MNLKRSLIIPAYNEEKTIKSLIELLNTASIFDEIIVVDDGSEDNTYNIIKNLPIKAIRHDKNKGKGASIKTGFAASKGDLIFLLDGDINAINTLKLKKMIFLIEEKDSDVVIGYFKPKCFQTFTEVIYKPLMSLLFPEVLKIIKHGALSGQRAIRRSVLKNLKLNDDFGFETSMNIGLTFYKRPLKISFVNLGTLDVEIKGFNKKMKSIASCIVDYAKKFGRINRFNESHLKEVIRVFYEEIEHISH